MSHERANTVALFGLPITNVTMAETLERIEEAIASGGMHQIATANLDFARNSLRSEALQKVICDCSMVLPDGAPMLWASRLFGKPLIERVTGVDLIPELARLSAQEGYGIFLLGSDERNTQAASDILAERHPGVKIVGRYSPPVSTLAEMDDDDILEHIWKAKPQILLVAFGNPKQELWIHRNRERLNVPVAIGIGGALEMIAGTLKRAPRWVQKVQMEWFFRLAQEPFRLLPRYANDAIALVRHLPVVLAASRLQPQEIRTDGLTMEMRGGVRVVKTPSTLTGAHCTGLMEEAHAAAAAAQEMVIDMSGTTRVEADGLGCLLHARRVVLAAAGTLCLAGVSRPVRRVLRVSAIYDLFGAATLTAKNVRFEEDTRFADERDLSYRPAGALAQHGRRASAEAIEV